MSADAAEGISPYVGLAAQSGIELAHRMGSKCRAEPFKQQSSPTCPAVRLPAVQSG